MADESVPITQEMLATAQAGQANPVSPSVPPGPPARTIEELAIGKDDPYPDGAPPAFEEGKPMGIKTT